MSESAPGDTGAPAGGAPSGEPQIDWKAKFEAETAEREKWTNLSRKNEEAAKANAAAAKKLADIERQGMTDVERLKSELAQRDGETGTMKSQVESLSTENARLKAGLEAGLSLADMAFIPSGTPEEMTKAAKTLAERLGAAQTPNFDGGGRPPATQPQTFSGMVRAQARAKRGLPPT
jgi:hypothetical protein